LATILARQLNAVLFNADAVREHVNRDLGFTLPDRVEHARRMGWLCDQVAAAGGYAVADFICPTDETREAFAAGGTPFVVWLDRIAEGRFEDTNRMFRPPERFDLRVTADGTPEYWAEQVLSRLRPVFDPKKPTALFVGRYQPFHDGHQRLITEGIRRVGQACIAVRDVQGTSVKDPFPFEYVRDRIEHAMRPHEGRFVIVSVPNITHVFYGRDVGYSVERIELDAATEAISATKVRARLGLVPRSA
jgi:adenylylsulfate kinase